jgi:cytochrome P450
MTELSTRLATPADLPDVPLFDPNFKADPYPCLSEWASKPPFWGNVQGKKCVVAARFADVQAVYADHHRFSSVKPPQAQMESVDYFNGTIDMAFSDEPDHGRLRSVLQPALTTPAVRRYEDGIDQLVEELLDEADRAGGQFDTMAALARPLSARALLGLVLGTPREDFPIFERLAASMHELALVPPGGERPAAYLDAWAGAREYCLGAAGREGANRSEVIGRVLHARDEGLLSDDELFGMLVTIYLGGLSTTATQLGNTVVHLASRPDQYERLRKDRTLVANAVEEALRFDSAGLFNYRFTVEDIQWAGLQIPASTTVYIIQQACGFDPAVVQNPLLFDVGRKPVRHLGFGFGIHRCIGAPIARAVIRAALASMVRRYAHLELAEDHLPVRYGGMAQERAPQEVWVRTA